MSPASATVVKTAQAPPSGALSAQRSSAIDTVYVAFVPFLTGAPAADVAHARRVCNALDRADRLLAATRRVCLSSIRLGSALTAMDTCGACLRATSRTRAALSELIARERVMNHLVRQELAPGSCRRALWNSASDLRDSERLLSVLRLLERGRRTHDRPLTQRALRRLRDLLREPDDDTDELAEFRRGGTGMTGAWAEGISAQFPQPRVPCPVRQPFPVAVSRGRAARAPPGQPAA